MIVILISIVVFFVIGLILLKQGVINKFFIMVIVLFGISMSYPISSIIEPEVKYIEIDKINILALNDNISINGNFYLGIGSIENSDYYYYYYKTEFNGQEVIKMDKKLASKVNIKYSNDDDPHILIYESRHTDAFINLFSLKERQKKFLIVIPEGSIQNTFNLDLK